MIGKDARKTIGSNGILEIKTKSPNPSWDIKWRVFCHWKTSKKCSLGWKYVDEGFGLKRLLLYLSKSVRVFLIHSPLTQGQPYICKVKAAYGGPSPHTHNAWKKPMFPYFERSFSLQGILKGSCSLKDHPRHIPSIRLQASKKQSCIETYNLYLVD